MFYWEKNWELKSWEENLANEFSSFKAEIETVELVKSDSRVVARGISTWSWRRERSELDRWPSDPERKVSVGPLTHKPTVSVWLRAAGELKATSLFYLLPHILLCWNSTWECFIRCPALKHRWYTKDMQLRLPCQILGPTAHIWEKLTSYFGHWSLVKALNCVKIFAFMFFESLN